ncbi:hypothetical protein ABTN73_20320, partial [Acinetobacter baumannii]
MVALNLAGVLPKPVRYHHLLSLLGQPPAGAGAAAATEPPAAARAAAPAPADTPPPGRAVRILVVEDNVTNQQVAAAR